MERDFFVSAIILRRNKNVIREVLGAFAAASTFEFGVEVIAARRAPIKISKVSFPNCEFVLFFVRRALQFTNIKLQHLLSQIALALKIHQVRDV